MNKLLLSTIMVGMPSIIFAQSAVDAFEVSQSELRGTARYMSMAGAFGALGGDLSTLANNPAGIGVYRSSEIGATLDVDFQRTTLNSGAYKPTSTQTRAACNNFGYIGAFSTGSETMPFFNFGVTYTRNNNYEQIYQGSFPSIGTSLTNYVANFTNGYNINSGAPDLSVLAYNTYLINPSGDSYYGLTDANSVTDATIQTRREGHTDQYNINFGGNVLNTVYWGIGFGITDISQTLASYYSEYIDNPIVPADDSRTSLVRGDYSKFGLENYQHLSGTGFNMNFGVILKPINEFRVGLAVQTPTWYRLDYVSNAWSDYNITADLYGSPEDDSYATLGEYCWKQKVRTPWRLIASAAGVIDGRFIISGDYEYKDYSSMSISDDWGKLEDVSSDIKQYYQGQHTVRVGAEYRVSPKFSVRLGYSYATAPTKTDVRNGDNYMFLSNNSTQPMFEMQNTNQYYTCGLGYRSGAFAIDLAYVHNVRKSSWQAFSDFPNYNGGYLLADNAAYAPYGELTDVHNRLVLSMGFRF
jgi:long-subunit fatty acid transport protein